MTDVDPWSEDKLATLPPAARPYVRDPNTRRIDYDVPNRPDDLDRSSAGIAPSRWNAVV